MGKFESMEDLNWYKQKLCYNCINHVKRSNQNSSGCLIMDKHINQTMVNLGHEEWQVENQELLDTFFVAYKTDKGLKNSKCEMFLQK